MLTDFTALGHPLQLVTHEELREPDERVVRVVALPLLDDERVVPVARGRLGVVVNQDHRPQVAVQGAEVLLVAALDVPGAVAEQLVHHELEVARSLSR